MKSSIDLWQIWRDLTTSSPIASTISSRTKTERWIAGLAEIDYVTSEKPWWWMAMRQRMMLRTLLAGQDLGHKQS